MDESVEKATRKVAEQQDLESKNRAAVADALIRTNFQKQQSQFAQDNQAIIEMYLKGHSRREIAQALNMDLGKVNACIGRGELRVEAEKMREELTREILQKKIPMLRKINNQTLLAVNEWLENVVENQRHLGMKASEIKQLMTITTMATDLLKLELGEPTENVAVVQTTHVTSTAVRDQLRDIDITGMFEKEDE